MEKITPEQPGLLVKDSPAELLNKMRAIGLTGTCFDPKHLSLESAQLGTEIFYNALGAHATADDYDSDSKGSTPLLDILEKMSCDCSPDERVQLFVISAGMLPRFRWIQMLYRVCDAGNKRNHGAFLRAFTESTSHFVAAIFGLLFGGSFTPTLALSVAASKLLGDEDVTHKRLLGLSLAIRFPFIRHQAKRKVKKTRINELWEKQECVLSG